VNGITKKSLLALLIGLLAFCLSGCCVADLFEDDDDVLPHNEGGGTDV
jgi:hypothetical protein